MKKFSSLILFIILPELVFSQHQSDKWYFGIYAGLDFTSGSPVPITDGALSTSEGCSSISDYNGNLLFYTDGRTVYDRDNQAMPNGTGLDGGESSTQAAIIVPLPGSSSQYYYIFTTDQIGGPLGFRYSVVDMTLNGGFGDVSTINELIQNHVTEKVVAEVAGNGVDCWVIAHDWGSNSFYAYKLSTAGLDPVPVVSSIGIVHNTSVIQNTYGQMKFSTCGEKLALAVSYQDTAQIFDFDRETGEVSNPISLPFYDHVYGLEFSPDGNLLYVTTNYDSYALWQFDLTSGNADTILASAEAISTLDGLNGLQLGPDHKIYAARAWSGYLGVINDPNVAGVNCNFDETGIYLDPNYQNITSSLGLPEFMQTFFAGENGCLPTGIHEVSHYENSVYPNPSPDGFTFSLSFFHHPNEITICNLQGEIVERYAVFPENENFLFGENLSAGMYSVLLKDDDGVKVMRVVKM
jgi:WD40 repeat protein